MGIEASKSILGLCAGRVTSSLVSAVTATVATKAPVAAGELGTDWSAMTRLTLAAIKGSQDTGGGSLPGQSLHRMLSVSASRCTSKFVSKLQRSCSISPCKVEHGPDTWETCWRQTGTWGARSGRKLASSIIQSSSREGVATISRRVRSARISSEVCVSA